MALDGFSVVCLEPGADNPKKHSPPPDPEPPEGFVDNTVYIYREKLDKDGNKVLIGTMDGYPEGWDDPAKRKMTPGSRWENSKEVEEIMAKYDWAELWPQVQKLLEAGNSFREIAGNLDIELSALRAKIYREKRIAEKQTPEPEPAEATNQEPERESQEPAENSIPENDPQRTTYTSTQYHEQLEGFTTNDDEPIPYQVEDTDLDGMKVIWIDNVLTHCFLAKKQLQYIQAIMDLRV